MDETFRILNHLADMMAEGHVLAAGQKLRFNGRRTLLLQDYHPGGTVPDVVLTQDRLLLADV